MESNDDGLIIGAELQKQKIPYIYVTAHTDVETMKKVLETNPHGFISKPIRNSELTVNIGLVIKGFVGYASRNIKIKVGNHVETIDLEDIIYIKSDGNYLEIFTDNKKHLKRCTIDQILEELDSPDFERIHRSIVVNKSYIQKVTVGAVILSNEVSLPVSRTFSRTTKE